MKIYVITAIRHLLKHKMHSILNLLGLTIAFTTAIVVSLFIKYEFSYDQQQPDAANIYRVIKENLDNEWRGTHLWNATSGLMKPTLQENCPEIKNVAQLLPIDEIEIVINNQHFMDGKFYFTGPEFLEIFQYHFLKGDPKTALIEPKSIVLTKSMAEKYFPEEDNPMGKLIHLGNMDFTVTGIMEDVPKNSHLPINFLASQQTVFDPSYDLNDAEAEWWNNNYNTYVEVYNDVDVPSLESKITKIVRDSREGDVPEAFQLQNIKDIHLYSHVNLESGTNGDILYIRVFFGIALLLLLIAGFNYMNLASAQMLYFTKETAIRKISGASKFQIVLLVFVETLLICLSAFVISMYLAYFILPSFAELVERELAVSMLWSYSNLAAWIGMVVLFALISCTYPAYHMMRQKPIVMLKIQTSKPSNFLNVRNILVVSQFTISIALIAGTIIFYRQLDFIQNKELGFQKNNIVNIIIPDIQSELKKSYSVLKEKLQASTNILDVTYAQTALDNDEWGGSAEWAGKSTQEDIKLYHLIVDQNYLDFYNIDLLDGELFSKEMKAKNNSSFILLNQAAVKALKWNEPVGRKLSLQMWKDSKVIGVVKDFNYQPLHLGIEPLAVSLGLPEDHANIISVKIAPNDVSGTLDEIKTIYKGLYPGYGFNYQFLDDQLSNAYRTDQKLGQLFGILSLISLVVAALGLFGSASFMAKRRIKEIGIRKVNGAKVSEVLALLNKDFAKWVVLAFFIATPIAWQIMKGWLENFAYRTTLDVWIFGLAGILALGITIITVSWQSWRAAITNPVDALRNE